ncbi:Folylpolyglutamate synthase [Handroanthus impetiginosus]|uniref:Folylpolyglutamate synthase n=1 Tax=Handroanthus impetiginosus TaxID=429701 RepID=A0A2G9GJQ4_9LAMI|nr:Folylpolyglutamate synthase [Handroanthus impetiginosus]
MTVYRNLCLTPEIVGVSFFHLPERLSSSKLRWTCSCFSLCMNGLDLTGIKRLHSQVDIQGKGFIDKKLLSQLPEVMDSNLMVEENKKNSNDSSAYETAMEALSSLITRKKRGHKSKVGGKYRKLERMLMYIKILGLEEHVADLKIIHVAGTKGKGSTCTFCEAILRECGFRTGLFTSPHLIDVRERFRLEGSDISEEKFLYYFWECWHQLKKNLTDDLPMPPLFQFLTVLAFKIFLCEKVDVAIIEVGLGGTKDSTNVIKNPVVCGVSPLGMDHMEAMGATLRQIASHKAGIFKPHVPAFTADSEDNIPEAFLRGLSSAHLPGRAQIVYDSSDTTEEIRSSTGDLIFYLDGAHSPESMEVCAKWFSSAVKDGQNRSSFSCNGHVQPIINGSYKISKKILLFNCMDVRDPEILLTMLVNECALSGIYFSKAIFVPSISMYNKVTSSSSAIPTDISSKDFTWQFNLQKVWDKIVHGKDTFRTFETKIPQSTPLDRFIREDVSVCSPSDEHVSCSSVVSSLPSTISWLRDYVKENPSSRIQVLVTGSLHLVGDVLKLLQR